MARAIKTHCIRGHIKIIKNGVRPNECLECRKLANSQLFVFSEVLALVKAGYSLTEVARALGRHSASIYSYVETLPSTKKLLLKKSKTAQIKRTARFKVHKVALVCDTAPSDNLPLGNANIALAS